MTTILGVQIETKRATIYTEVASQLYRKVIEIGIDTSDTIMVELSNQYAELMPLIEPLEHAAWYASPTASANEIYAAFEAWIALPKRDYREFLLLWREVTASPNDTHLTPSATLATIADEKKEQNA